MTCPQLDYYIGQTVERMESPEGEFTLVMSDARITVEGASAHSGYQDVTNMELLNVTMGAEQTQMNFGMREGETITYQRAIIMSPMDYRIADEKYPGGPHYPQRSMDDDIEASRPADPSAERDKGGATGAEDEE